MQLKKFVSGIKQRKILQCIYLLVEQASINYLKQSFKY